MRVCLKHQSQQWPKSLGLEDSQPYREVDMPVVMWDEVVL